MNKVPFRINQWLHRDSCAASIRRFPIRDSLLCRVPIHRAAPCATSGLRSAEGRSAGAAETTESPFSSAALETSVPSPHPSHAKPLAVRAGPVSTPQTYQNPRNPHKPNQIRNPKTWHSYPTQLDTLEVEPKFKSCTGDNRLQLSHLSH